MWCLPQIIAEYASDIELILVDINQPETQNILPSRNFYLIRLPAKTCLLIDLIS